MPNPIKALQEARAIIDRTLNDILPIEHRKRIIKVDDKIKNALQELLQRGIKE